jgi:steroid delta-isomerase-like uncharacterized protein
MSAKENIALLRQAAEHFSNPGDKTAYFELYDAKVIFHGYQGVEPDIESVKKFYRAFWQAFPDCVLIFDDVFAVEDKLACRFVVRATHKGEFLGIPPTGKTIALPGITILRFANGKCAERWTQADFLGLLQQLGAVPQ